jgi:hypothetical protein
VASVIVEEPEVVTVLGLKFAVVPAGSPETLKPTGPVKPPRAVTVTFEVALPPALTDREAGEAESAKSEMFKLTVVV